MGKDLRSWAQHGTWFALNLAGLATRTGSWFVQSAMKMDRYPCKAITSFLVAHLGGLTALKLHQYATFHVHAALVLEK